MSLNKIRMQMSLKPVGKYRQVLDFNDNKSDCYNKRLDTSLSHCHTLNPFCKGTQHCVLCCTYCETYRIEIKIQKQSYYYLAYMYNKIIYDR